jgi:uncharacterized protein
MRHCDRSDDVTAGTLIRFGPLSSFAVYHHEATYSTHHVLSGSNEQHGMYLYLPIAEMSVNVWLLVGVGCAVGFLSGMFGVGGGFIITPLLIVLGIPPAVAVGTGSTQVVASSVSGAFAQYRRGNVDIKMGLVLIAGGLVGTFIGVEVVRILRRAGQFDLFVALAYVIFLGIIGTLMLLESLASMRKHKSGQRPYSRRGSEHGWIHGLPFKLRFRRSKLYISALPPLAIGAFVGFLAAIMGIGGGFIMLPAMIYLLRMPTNVVVGTSLFHIVFVTAATTILQAATNNSVDLPLAMLLVTGGVIGAQFGAAASEKLRGEQLRFLLAALVLLVCLRVGYDLIVQPAELYSIMPLVRGLE